MLKNYQLFIFIFLVLLLTGCSHSYTLEIIADASCFKENRKPLKVFLIKPENYIKTFTEIKNSNREIAISKLGNFYTDLYKIHSSHKVVQSELDNLNRIYGLNLEKLKTSLTDSLRASITHFSKYDDIWQFWIKFSNYGNEHIDEFTIDIFFNDELIIEEQSITLSLPPGAIKLEDNFFCDISTQPGISQKMDLSSNDREKFLSCLRCEIKSVSSDFSISLNEIRNQIDWKKNELLSIENTIDQKPDESMSDIENSVITPTNKILDEMIQEEAIYSSQINSPGSVNYRTSKSNDYILLVYTSPDEYYQWKIDVSLEKNQSIGLTTKNRSLFFLTDTSIRKSIDNAANNGTNQEKTEEN